MAPPRVTFSVEAAVQDYKDGMSLKAVAAKYGVSFGTIQNRFNEVGVVIDSNRRQNQDGASNTNWKGGTSRATVYRRSLQALFLAGRDQYTCERCGTKMETRGNIHHKNRNRADDRPANLEVLCPHCHATEHLSERERNELGRLV
jgi:DNA-directed RNA polymerase subunit RPC12/RpoP